MDSIQNLLWIVKGAFSILCLEEDSNQLEHPWLVTSNTRYMQINKKTWIEND